MSPSHSEPAESHQVRLAAGQGQQRSTDTHCRGHRDSVAGSGPDPDPDQGPHRPEPGLSVITTRMPAVMPDSAPGRSRTGRVWLRHCRGPGRQGDDSSGGPARRHHRGRPDWERPAGIKIIHWFECYGAVEISSLLTKQLLIFLPFSWILAPRNRRFSQFPDAFLYWHPQPHGINLSLAPFPTQQVCNVCAMQSSQQVVRTRPIARLGDRPKQESRRVILSLDTIKPHFAWPLKVASLRLGVGETALKWWCFIRWLAFRMCWSCHLYAVPVENWE